MKEFDDGIEKVGNDAGDGQWDKDWLQITQNPAGQPDESHEECTKDEDCQTGDGTPEGSLLKFAGEGGF